MKKEKARMKNINFIAVVFFVLFSVVYLVNEKYHLFGQHNSDTTVLVVSVHDGDTVSVILNKKQEKVRLTGIDAPEMAQEPWGREAKKHLETLLNAAIWKVRLEYDIENKDRYGRILAYLWTDDRKFINLMMIKSGYAMLYTFPPNVKYVNELRAAQKEAREGKLGIWSEEGLKERPGDYRKEHPRL